MIDQRSPCGVGTRPFEHGVELQEERCAFIVPIQRGDSRRRQARLPLGLAARSPSLQDEAFVQVGDDKGMRIKARRRQPRPQALKGVRLAMSQKDRALHRAAGFHPPDQAIGVGVRRIDV